MKLFYSPGSCSLAVHIVLLEAGLPYELAQVDLWNHTTTSGEDYFKINPKGTVPTLECDEALLTEGPAILQYIADRYAPSLVPVNGTLERTRLQESLNYLASDYHKSFTPLFYLARDADASEVQRPVIAKLTYLEGVLAKGGPYITGDAYTIADPYLFALTRWCKKLNVSLSPFPVLRAYMARMGDRPAIRSALKAEGLDPEDSYVS